MIFLIVLRPPRFALFPYTTLFRSRGRAADRHPQHRPGRRSGRRPARRSEEHTSELQSRQYLVCRLLLEKKNTKDTMELPEKSRDHEYMIGLMLVSEQPLEQYLLK